MAEQVTVVSSTVGLDNLYYAKITKDDSTGITYAAPKRLKGAVKLKASKKVSSEVFYGDNQKLEVAESDGETEVEIEVQGLALSVKADLEGYPEVVDGVLDEKRVGEKPYVALGYRFMKGNGKYRYVWLLKGKLSQEEEEAETKKDKPDFKTTPLKGTFIERDYDGRSKYTADADEPTFTQTVADSWFTAVYSKTPVTP
ncbi:major tail protein [Bacillus pseudomycoides]|uniref:major tail protein n=1 Tax=Bacillus pseudomycoides TaxID=64104 RepID=UPI002FFD98F8